MSEGFVPVHVCPFHGLNLFLFFIELLPFSFFFFFFFFGVGGDAFFACWFFILWNFESRIVVGRENIVCLLIVVCVCFEGLCVCVCVCVCVFCCCFPLLLVVVLFSMCCVLFYVFLLPKEKKKGSLQSVFWKSISSTNLACPVLSFLCVCLCF